MPKFFYTVVGFTLFLWAGVLYLGSELRPDVPLNVFTFLLGVFGAAGLTLAILIFIWFHWRASLFMNRHLLFRKSVKRGFFLSFVLTGTLSLRAFDLFTLLNYALFLALCLLVYKQFKSSRI